jgi:hypothetical protein
MSPSQVIHQFFCRSRLPAAMVGGERERKGKRVEARFNDRKRPKPTQDELKSLQARREGMIMVSERGSSYKYCPCDGEKLVGRYLKCPKCLEEFVGKIISDGGPSMYAVLVDAREFATFWRRKLLWKLVPPFHAWVVWTTQPPVPVAAFQAIISKAWTEDEWKTSAVKTIVKKLETTWAVEEFCQFESVNPSTGLRAGKLLASGSIMVIVPPLEVVHTESKVAGSKVSLTFGWVLLTSRGNISKAESMDVPPQGWDHVEARVRDIASRMRDFKLDVSPDLIKASEAKLLAKYGDDKKEFLEARAEREMDRSYHILRLKKESRALAEPKATIVLGEDCEVMAEDFNPYEAYHQRI